eukprot:340115_1
MNANSDLKSVLKYMDTNNYSHLLSDYHHILQKHLNHETALKNCRNFQYIHDKIAKHINCDVYKCNPYQRNNRNREKEQQKETKGVDKNDSKLLFLSDILDSIHVYFVHSFETGFRIPVNFFGNDENKKDDMTDEDNNDITDTVDHKLFKLSSHLKQKRKELFEIRGVNNTNQNKFVTEKNLNADDNKQEYKNNNDIKTDIEYGFGQRFDYWSDKGEWCIIQKYLNMKKEILSKNMIPINAYDDVYYKANKLLNESVTLKKRQMVKMVGCYGSEYSKDSDTIHDIKRGTPMQIEHVMSLLFYTNFTLLSYEFSKSFRGMSLTETNESIKNR